MRPQSRERTLEAVADLIGARLVGPADAGTRMVRGVAALGEAGPDEVTFLANPRYRAAVAGTRAAAVILAEAVEGLSVPQLVVPDPYPAYARLMDALYATERKPRGISPDARVDPSARVGEAPDIGPFATVGPGAVIGARATLHPGVHVGAGCTLGDDVTLYPGVVVRENARLGNRVTVHALSVIGSDGFGYATQGGVHRKIPHIGRVVVEDDVEIGSNVTIDRAVLGETVVGTGTKIDNQVQVAHNVKIGRGCLIAAQVGLSGSAAVGDHVVLAGQVGVAGHLKIGDRARVGGKAGVTKDVPDGQTVSGFPAGPHREQMKAQAMAARLPELRERVAALERQLRHGAGAEDKQGEEGA